MSASFGIIRSWLSRKGSSELDATFCRLAIMVDSKNVSEFLDEYRSLHEHLEIPAYFLAEWIAENWWPLLWEPRKNEDALEDDREFVARHSILAAQHGFALPAIQFVPTGKSIFISAKPRVSTLAEVRFPKGAVASPSRGEVESELRKFVDATVQRLENASISSTGLQEAWAVVNGIGEDEVQFCQFAGALGLAPHEVEDQLADLLENLLPRLGQRLLMDLCLASKPESFESMAKTAEAVYSNLSASPVANLQPLLSVPVAADNFNVAAWHRGKRAAAQLRNRFSVSEIDPHGAAQIFEGLGIDPAVMVSSGDDQSLSGAVSRDGDAARFAFLQALPVHRRFAAARGLFAAWTSEQKEARFLTSAVTRDQQANRAFAAELTAPIAFLRKNAKRSRLRQDQVLDLAAELEIGADVVLKQALNNGLQVVPI